MFMIQRQFPQQQPVFSFEIAARNSRTRDVACPVPVRVRRILNTQIQHRLRHFASILFVLLCRPHHSCSFQTYLRYALATRAQTMVIGSKAASSYSKMTTRYQNGTLRLWRSTTAHSSTRAGYSRLDLQENPRRYGH